MFARNRGGIGLTISLMWVCLPVYAAHAEDTPRAIVRAAIKAHGGAENIAKTLTGMLRASGKLTLAPNVESSVSWQESFELPRRHRRSITGQLMGKDFAMEYAVTEGSGWIRQNNGKAEDFKGKKLPLSSSWNAVLALLPLCLAEGVELKLGAKERIEGREAVGVSVSGEALGGEAVLFFDAKSSLLLRSKRRMQLLSPDEVDGEVLLSDYKVVSGVLYPHRITSHAAGRKIAEMAITHIEFLDTLEDRLFNKP